MYIIEVVRSKSKKGGFFWRLMSINGRTLATSEMYARKPMTVVEKLCGAFKRGQCKVVDLTTVVKKTKKKVTKKKVKKTKKKVKK